MTSLISKQSSNITPYMVLNKMENINITTRDIANKYHISDTSVHYIFLQYLDIKRLLYLKFYPLMRFT